MAGSLLAGDDVTGVLVLDGDSDDVRTTPLRSDSFDVRGSDAFNDHVRLVGERLLAAKTMKLNFLKRLIHTICI